MCGIIGIIGKDEVAERLVDGLRRLEYRGYDSAGIATVHDRALHRCRAEGKLINLMRCLVEQPVAGMVGIGHTRWATHGAPCVRNAHPHASTKVAVVHNGIIENFAELKAELVALGHVFESDTDTEVVVHLISHRLEQGETPEEATHRTLCRLHGAFALGVVFADYPDLLIAARQGSPLALGFGDGEMYLGSDAFALAPLTQKLCYLEDGDWAVLTRDGATIRNRDGALVERPVQISQVTGAMIGKGSHRHFMLKEIHEQPQVIGDILSNMLSADGRKLVLPPLPVDPVSCPRVTIIACGTSSYAAMVAKYWIESLAHLAVDVDIASEFRYRKPVLTDGGLAIVISQSGETADTLAALRYCREHGQKTLALVNVEESTIAREADARILTHAGPEIGVASTKAFTAQLTVLAVLAVALAEARKGVTAEQVARLTQALTEIPARIADVLTHGMAALQKAAEFIAPARDVLYLGRGTSYAIALEGALKLKEISYIHAEAYAAGELKHGPIALIDEHVPVIVVCPSDDLYEKTASNVQEVAARGGKVVFLSDRAGMSRLSAEVALRLDMPAVDAFVAPILYAVPVQILAYTVAVLKGTDVDQPRNLAKSVTVE